MRTLLLSILLATTADAQTVGMLGRVEEIVLPAPERQAVPPTDESSVVLRIESTYPHGDAFRYNLVYYGLEAGSYDLADYLTPRGDLPAIPVTITATLPPDRFRPHAPATGGAPSIGGYRGALIAAGVVWLLVLALLVATGRRRRAEDAAEEAPPPTAAERLRPLVEKAQAGQLTTDEQARLERLVLTHWRGKLGTTTIAELRDHPEAGDLVRTLEEWLHRPGGAGREADIAALLKPYSSAP